MRRSLKRVRKYKKGRKEVDFHFLASFTIAHDVFSAQKSIECISFIRKDISLFLSFHSTKQPRYTQHTTHGAITKSQHRTTQGRILKCAHTISYNSYTTTLP